MRMIETIRKHHRLWSTLLITIGVIALCLGGVMLYASDYYPADETALAALAASDTVSVQQTADSVVFMPETPVSGFIFYPGGKVEHTAYAPLLHALAEEGVLCVLMKMPLRLAVLDMNAADGIAGQYPGITRWSIGGHSLGGAMAASYAAGHAQELDGLVLLAAYSTAALPDSLSVVSLYGTEDAVLDRAKYEQYRVNLPAHAAEIEIPGGNHAQFGSYGTQAGDGTASITADAQLAAAVQSILPVLTGAQH